MFENLKNNWKSGITVSLVSIPLSVSLAVASQTSPVVGIITAIWAGLIHSLFGGSKFNVVGPTGALSGILAAYALVHGANSLAMLAIVSGVYIIAAYLLKLEKYIAFIPASTVHGFTLGVAIIIALNQFNFALGLNDLEKHPHFIANVIESLKNITAISFPTFGVFVIFFVVLLLISKFLPKIPGAILLAPIGILLGYLSNNGIIPIELSTLGESYSDMSAMLFMPFKFELSRDIFLTALTVAIVAILETMISAKIADGMTNTKHNRRKEILGLGLANIGAGLAGGMPATAALARTALNIKTQATHNISSSISSIMVAVISFFFLTFFKFIPLSVIAAILVFTAFRMIEKQHFIRMFRHDKLSLGIALLVAFVTIYEDPIIGILFGTAVMLLVFMQKLSKGQFEYIMKNENQDMTALIHGDEIKKVNEGSHTLIYSVKGQLAYINTQSHISRFEEHFSGKHNNIILRMSEMYFIDLDGVDAFDEIIDIIHSEGKLVLVSGVNPFIERILSNDSECYRDLKAKGLVFNRTKEALAFLKEKV
ncbi:SulP family inorganic anion transporter [Candidatus Dojkabacteria bacterium]|nr:SulP family inorganic anion transporter [Candidatus Dojkabacteria bacterium]